MSLLFVVMALLAATMPAAASPSLRYAIGGQCGLFQQQQSWMVDLPANTIKVEQEGKVIGCLSSHPNWNTLTELVVAPCEVASPKQHFEFDGGLIKHGTEGCLALNKADGATVPGASIALRLEVSDCGAAPLWTVPESNGGELRTVDGTQCVVAATIRPTSWAVQLFDLWTGHDAFVPTGIYRIPSMITTKNGTLIAFAQAREHSTDATPSSLVMRRSFDDGESWEPSRIVLRDLDNSTMHVGETLYDPATDKLFFFENHVDFRNRHPGCSSCLLWQMSSADHGLTWSNLTVIKLADPDVNQTEPWGGGNRTFGGGLASGIALEGGPHKGRIMAALRHDCGCNDQPASFVVYSDDHGATWVGGALLPEAGEHGMPGPINNQTNGAKGGWTECQVAELRNGSVLLTSRNLYNTKSGLDGRMFARSDDGGANWAQVWSELTDPGLNLTSTYCEASMVAVPSKGLLYLGKPTGPRRRAYQIHSSNDSGLVWNGVSDVWPGGAAYSSLSMTQKGDVAFVFERGPNDRIPYQWVSFGKVSV